MTAAAALETANAELENLAEQLLSVQEALQAVCILDGRLVRML